MSTRVLVTGHNGYIGSVLAPLLQDVGYEVTGLDTAYYRECTLRDHDRSIPQLSKDIRDLSAKDLEGYHAVVHLAALSNDPLGNLCPDWTREINLCASVRMAQMAKASGVPRFLFSSSCIMYGTCENVVASEDSPLDPKTDYAQSKVEAEKAISALASNDFSPTFLRNGTVYGLSPRMRFDTVLNDLIATAMTTGRVVVHTNGEPWRPVVHIEDVARAFLAALEAPADRVHNQAFNTGSSALNCRVLELAEIATETVPGCKLEVRAEPTADHRTYKADFSKFAAAFPQFEFHWRPRDGALDLCERLRSSGITYGHVTDKRFTRVRWLRHLIEEKLLDSSLRWTNSH